VLFRMGDHRAWIQWFANAVASGGKAQRALVSNVEHVKRRWYERLTAAGRRPRSDAAVFAALDLLPRHVVLTSQVLVSELGVSRKAALATLRRLESVEILSEYGTVRRQAPGQPPTLYVARDLIGLSGSSPLR
jgi:hypothetical protein